jgi:integrase
VKKFSPEVMAFVGHMRSSGDNYSDETIQRYADWLSRVEEIIKPKTLKEFTEDNWIALNNWCIEEEFSWAYVYGLKGALKKYWLYCKINIVKQKPWFKLPKKKGYKNIEKAYNREVDKEKLVKDIEKVFATIYDYPLDKIAPNEEVAIRNKVIFILNYFCATRRGEIKRMLIEDLDFHTKKVIIRDSKGSQIVDIPVTENKFWVVMQKYLNDIGRSNGSLFVATRGKNQGKTMHKNTVSKIVKDVGFMVYGKNMWSHFLRFFRGSELGIILPPDQLQRYLRHKNITTTMKFYRSKGLIDREMMKNLKQKEGDAF